MDDSIAQSGEMLAPFELAGWKTWLGAIAALLTSLLFFSAGLWKITDAPGWAVKLAQLKVPQGLSVPGTVVLGILETFSAVLLLVPRFRRWGAGLSAFLLVVFMIYVGVNYNALLGADCSCFPWLKRAVGPGFFVGDAAMLGCALLAGLWSKRSENMRGAVLILAAVSVFSLVSYGVAATRNNGLKAPDSVTVDGKPFSLQEGKILIFFFNPECTHCLDAARRMSKYNWADARIVAVPTEQPQFAPNFMRKTQLPGVVSLDTALLRKTFSFVDAPSGVALENGRQKAAISQFEGEEPEVTLKKLGFVK